MKLKPFCHAKHSVEQTQGVCNFYSFAIFQSLIGEGLIQSLLKKS